MKHTILICLLIVVLLAACNSAAPTPLRPAINGIETGVAGTLTAQAAAVTMTPTETVTPPPVITASPTGTAKPTQTPKPTKTRMPKDVVGCFAPGGAHGPTAPFKLEAHTNQKVVIFINGTSRNGDDTVYCTEIVKQGLPQTLNLMWGNYTYMVQVGSKITMRGSFFINNPDKATMQVFNDKVRIGPFP